MKPIAFISLLSAALLGGAVGCSRSDGLDDPEKEDSETCSIAWLKSQGEGASRLLTEAIVVRGRVVANDRFGEWSRALVIEDETGGLTIFADAARLADRYPFGATVVLYCNGLRLYDYGGKIVVGAEPSAYGFGIDKEEIAAHLHRGEDCPSAPEPRVVSLGGIGAELVDTYVEVRNVRFHERGSWCDRDPATGRYVDTERTIVDEAGHTFIVRTSGGCVYAKEPLPEGKGSIGGVVDCFNGKYTLRVVNREIDFSSEWP